MGRPPSRELSRGRTWGLIRGGGELSVAGVAGTEGGKGRSGSAGEMLLVAALLGRNSFSQPWLLAMACQRPPSSLTLFRGFVGLQRASFSATGRQVSLPPLSAPSSCSYLQHCSRPAICAVSGLFQERTEVIHARGCNGEDLF